MRNANRSRVMVVAPGRMTRGGITAVVNAYATHAVWKKWDCMWIETHSDRNIYQKLFYFLRAVGRFMVLLPAYDIIHIHFSEPVSAVRKLFFMVPARILRKKIILHFHSFSPDTTIRSRFASLYRWMFRRADQVVVLSETWKEQVCATCGRDLPIQVIYNPAFIQRQGTEIRQPYILFAGTLNGRKGYADLIRAFSKISGKHQGWNLVLAGNGELDEADALSSELGVRDRVVLPGWVHGKNKEDLFNHAGIFCLPSYAEGFPMAVIDAMAHRVPVISTPVGGITDIFTESNDLMLVPPGRPDELAMKLDLMIAHPGMRQNMAVAAYGKIERFFDLDLVAGQLDQLYGNLGRKVHA
jgi:glycosyltransferase involved in cell wall biosynthesis